MRKYKLYLLIICIMFVMTPLYFVEAEEIRVFDQADLLTESEEQQLEKRIRTMEDVWEMHFLIVTSEDTEGKSSRDYADDFYDQCFSDDSDADGILYLIDMDHREIYLSTSGKAISYLTDDRIENILDRAYEEAAKGSFYFAFEEFLDATEIYLNRGIEENLYVDYNEGSYTDNRIRISGMEIFAAFAAALLVSGGVCGWIIGKYRLKFEDFHYHAHTDSELHLYVQENRLENSFVTHRRIPRNNGSSGGGVRSGGGGRSSVHRSSGGRSHGGGGRKF